MDTRTLSDAIAHIVYERFDQLKDEPHPFGNDRCGTRSAVDYCQQIIWRGNLSSKGRLLAYLQQNGTTVGYAMSPGCKHLPYSQPPCRPRPILPRGMAMIKNQPTFWTGRRCRRGHDSDRDVLTKRCLECMVQDALAGRY